MVWYISENTQIFWLSERLYQVEVFAKLPHEVVKDPQCEKVCNMVWQSL